MRALSGTLLSLFAFSGAACSGSDESPGFGGSGGAIASTGGATTVGGNVATGGNSTSMGGAPSNGGSNASGGSTSATGGSSSTQGGSTTTGGAAPTSGGSSQATGGASSNGGSNVGGTPSKGGTTSSGGGATGGTATGGKAAGGGATGGAATGGKAGTGGAGTGGSSSTCTEADKTLTSNQIGTHCGYTYEYWKDQGTGTLVLKAGGFSTSWSSINNLLGRKGLRPGSTNQIVTYSANYQPNGNSYLCVYGWTKGPLIEYYIVDSWGSWRPPGGTSLGTVSSDGGTYDIYRTQRVNQPSIEGTATFYQFWSVRTAKRTSGTITVANHFSAWAAEGMSMGALYEVSMTVEGYQSSGTADVTMSMR